MWCHLHLGVDRCEPLGSSCLGYVGTLNLDGKQKQQQDKRSSKMTINTRRSKRSSRGRGEEIGEMGGGEYVTTTTTKESENKRTKTIRVAGSLSNLLSSRSTLIIIARLGLCCTPQRIEQLERMRRTR